MTATHELYAAGIVAVLAGAGATVSLIRLMAQWRSAAKRICAMERLLNEERDARAAADAKLRSALAELDSQLQLLTPAGGARPALNISLRSQALRMYRHGADTETIAGTLGLARNEVRLLVKVHDQLLTHAPRN